MATRAQKIKVGVFVVACSALIAAGLLLVSGYKHEVLVPYWIEFNESILGLGAGGGVEYKGVPVGSVKNIFVTEDGRAHVDILVSAEKVQLHEGVTAQLVLYSLATGVLVVMLDGGDASTPELAPNSQIPETTSWVASVSSRAEGILKDLSEILDRLSKSLSGMEEGDLNDIAKNLDSLVSDARKFVNDLDETVNGVREDAQAGMANFRKLTEELQHTVAKANDTLDTLRGKVAELKLSETEDELQDLLKNMAALSDRLSGAAGTIDTVCRSALNEVDNVEYGLRETLRTATETLDSIKTLTDSIEKDPAQMLRGKGKPSGGK